MFYVTPIGQPCERHKTLPAPDEPCWRCEHAVTCNACGETDPDLRDVHGFCYDEDACVGREHRREGAAVVFGIIALGTWAAERDRSHRFAASLARTLEDNYPLFHRMAMYDNEEGNMRRVAVAAEKHIRRHEQPEAEQGTTYLKLEAAVVAWTGRPKHSG